MNLPEFSVNRPVTTSMFFIGVLILGFISLTRLPRELFPSITYPQLTIVTTYENAAPEEVETLITKIIEETVGTVSNLKRISSVSKEGVSIVTAEFGWGANMDFASLGVREKIDLIKERLPLGSSDPIVMKFNPFEMPVITLSVIGEKSPSELLRLSRKFIKDELEKVEGVASCNIAGGIEREILVSVDGGRLHASSISITKVVDSLKSSNLNYPAGTIEEHFYEYLIRTMGEFKVVPEIKETVVGKDKSEEDKVPEIPQEEQGEKKSRLIFLKDIADIKDTFQEKTSISRYNGQENISISVQKQAGVNTMRVAQNVRDKLVQIKRDLPPGMEVNIVYDQSIFIKKSIRGVMDAAIQGGILAFLVLFVFLRNIKASLIVAFSMPMSIMVAFSLMYFNGITLNMLSLGGLALGVGMLVDNAIVVIENIYSHLQKKKDIKEASKSGASEMSGAIFSSTLTTVAVFLPMIFVVGVAGQLFKELAFTVTFSLLASLVIALSLIPRLAAIKTDKLSKERPLVQNKKFTFGLESVYARIVPLVLKFKWIFLIAVLSVYVLSMGLFFFIDKEFMPKVDQREFVMKLTMPSGTKLDITDNVVKKIEEVFFGTKEVEGVAVSIGSSKKKDFASGLETMGSHQAQSIVTLKKGKQWPATSKVIERLKDKFSKLNLGGAEIEYVVQESVFKTALQGSAPIVIEIKGKKLDEIEKVAGYIKEDLLTIKGIYGIRTSLTQPAPETKVNIIKDRAALYNLSAAVIAQAAHTAIKGVVATKFKEEGREIDVRVRLRKEDRSNLSQVRNVLVYSPLDIQVPLSEVAYITQGIGPSEIKRLDQQRVVLVTANISDRALDKVIRDVKLMLDRIEREKISQLSSKDSEKDITLALSGESQQMNESFQSLRFALLLSILLVYMIMAAQFESLWQPFIIMFSVPLSIMGVLVALFVTHTPISVVVMLGVIILGGIVVNNGIILIDTINNLRSQGMDLTEAVIESGKTRLRPILMTTMTTVLGLLPLAMGIAEGSELQSPMAITVMGGLTISTILTLFVIPCIFTIVAGVIMPKADLKPKPAFVMPQSKPVPVLRTEKPLSIQLPESVKPEPKAEKPKIEPPAAIALPEKKPEGLSLKLNKRQEQFLEHLRVKKKITRKEYSQLFKISVPTAARDLKELVDKNIIIARGPLGPGRWYELKLEE
ncbi:MAG: efflux RND transporter permease subunit [Candidatus Omnitrophica bacterium]|nr:efflux RND transporter permease subunit [Candidatus Omnitrophota bacterium]